MNLLLERFAALVRNMPLLLNMESDVEGQLDKRDAPEWEKVWLATADELSNLERGFSVTPQDTLVIDQIRECAYKQAYRAHHSPDLAGYVSDDFDLIARALRIGYESRWLNGLLEGYMRGVFPHDPSHSASGSLASLLHKHEVDEDA